ncbi:2-succinyl-6-hydroxy-2,4-cyclohexadiene-1-carboxylate synthase [Ectothiorhodosinus mongolicus]|uniref:2-succinyl-6-hydroxy-2,4-cyclohexadiene-1-carboxylate synthase n=1 Tax=Ectothiorhodosinus mongolicus TaxID=233100 RepID=A0A1R3W4L0_9GAMM|nr:2-succinyl-6-hydroxy-2,4-cyclohexadiene-1-carboxylate synthase [Ectothiorhodosinus mongolicus]SIT70918.1 2-succinyl-6-hydroxy-2,4-cyclohexadiene-1-carboxylate synthase [Ectothiorhodosinus mongolicus]
MMLPLVLLHGFLGSGDDWQDVRRHWPNQRALISPNLPDAQTLAGSEDSANIEVYSRYAWEQLQTNLPEQFHLLGYSLGGRIAMHWASQATGRIQSLLLESAHPGLPNQAARRERLIQDRQWAQRFASEPLSEVLHDWYQQAVFQDLSDCQRTQLISARRRQDPAAMAALMRVTSLGEQADLMTQLSQQKTFKAYITGGQDAKFMATAQALQAQKPCLKLVLFDTLGHNCHAGAPAAFAERISHLLSNEERPS